MGMLVTLEPLGKLVFGGRLHGRCSDSSRRIRYRSHFGSSWVASGHRALRQFRPCQIACLGACSSTFVNCHCKGRDRLGRTSVPCVRSCTGEHKETRVASLAHWSDSQSTITAILAMFMLTSLHFPGQLRVTAYVRSPSAARTIPKHLFFKRCCRISSPAKSQLLVHPTSPSNRYV